MNIIDKNFKDDISENACFRLFFLTSIKFCTSDTSAPMKKYQVNLNSEHNIPQKQN